MLLTSMPGTMDYFILASVFSLGFSFIVSIFITFIISIINKSKNKSINYIILWLKIFGIMFISFELIIFIILIA